MLFSLITKGGAMSYESKSDVFHNVETLPSPTGSSFVTDELMRIAALARSVCPPDTDVSFSFDRKLMIHLDIRLLEDVTRVEVLLEVRGAGLFSELQRRPTPNPRFFRRLTARVHR